MKLKSVSGIFMHALSLDLTRDFYESLGFRIGEITSESLTCYVNWFWIEFRLDTTRSLDSPQSTDTLAVRVDDIEAYYRYVLELGYHPETEPTIETGRITFTLKDPNGHTLTFFQKH